MLDNPIWNALQTRHARFAIRKGRAMRYPPQINPMAGVEGEDAEADLRGLIGHGEKVGLLSVIPPLRDGWTVDKSITIHQFLWPDDLQVDAEPEAIPLDAAFVPAMLELTALVYPAYFRPETVRLGDYFGIVQDGRLCAMGGIRLSMDGYRELSAICTHPDHRGRGYASRLTSHLVHHVRSLGDRAFLHTESDNTAAQSLYRKLGFELRAEMPFRVVTPTEP